MASVDYFISGIVTTKEQAQLYVAKVGLPKGYDIADIKSHFRIVHLDNMQGEEAREYLEGITSCSLEIVLVRD